MSLLVDAVAEDGKKGVFVGAGGELFTGDWFGFWLLLGLILDYHVTLVLEPRVRPVAHLALAARPFARLFVAAHTPARVATTTQTGHARSLPTWSLERALLATEGLVKRAALETAV